ncbi:tetratricopeptide repeat protein [Psychromonas antarctica]|uniref:tetratricopeptide repeat protein n=1 Tax=Psychromonas antarctica TaxID=67573 RepID=UPI001EE90958|nr:tetratricopeptide repeat protein [Psychromonas antarctica]MCG6202660.1 sel1 repeat family protein [Psychromonas antarctica]
MHNNKITLSFLLIILISLFSCTEYVSDEVSDELTKARTAYIDEDYGTAMKIWKELSEQEIPESLWGVGILYESGYGVKQNFKTAKEWFTKAEKHNYAPAQHSLGLIYYFGYGVKVNKQKALEYYIKSAEQNFSPAMYLLGIEYEEGVLIKQDIKKAESLFRESLELGYQESEKALLRIQGINALKSIEQTINEGTLNGY